MPRATDDQLTTLLRRHWGHAAFRPLQLPIIKTLLDGEDVLALLPTGGGKSLCYQLPALALRGCVLVVSPLIALMQDQVEGLERRDIPATTLAGPLTEKELRQRLQAVADGGVKLLYTSPERLQSPLLQASLPNLGIAAIAVDEAHCISQWGHDFRPEYRMLRTLRRLLPRVPVIALTASATPRVAEDIRAQLYLKGSHVFRESFHRTNITYEVRPVTGKDAEAVAILQSAGVGKKIVYCQSRRRTELLARLLFAKGIRALAYHAGMDSDERAGRQASWAGGEADVMVCTTAFGMGIDQPDVRLVLHDDLPENPERYYQETGRAGRDGQPSKAILLLHRRDIRALEASTALHFPPLDYLRKVYQAVAEHLQINIGDEPPGELPFHSAGFCKKFGLKETEAKHALKQLAKEGLWSIRSGRGGGPKLVFTTDRQRLDELRITQPALSLVALWLLRLYEDILHTPVAIDVHELARRTKQRLAQVQSALQSLHQQGLARYEGAQGSGDYLRFLHRRADSRFLLVDMQGIQARRDAHEAQVQAMLRYATLEQGCRTALMLQYFGEKLDQPCGHCDRCQAQQPVAPNKSGDLSTEALLLMLLKEHPGGLPIQRLLSQAPHLKPQQASDAIRRLADAGEVRFITPVKIALARAAS